MIIYYIILSLDIIALIYTIYRYCRYILFNKMRYKCPVDELFKEKSRFNAKEKFKLKRCYCLNKCKHGCGILVMLKKIYWENRK